MDCLNAELFEIGSREQRSTVSPWALSDMYTEYDAVVMGETEIDGPLEVEIQYTQMRGSHSWNRQRLEYVKLVNGEMQVLNYGYSDAPNPLCDECSETSYRYDPAVAFRYDLSPGDEYEQTFVASIKHPDRTCFAVGSCPTEFTVNATETIRYLGGEIIEVPAGRFETCKFERVWSDDGGLNTSVPYHKTLWLGVGSGLKIREDDGDIAELLNSAAINGQPVVGD